MLKFGRDQGYYTEGCICRDSEAGSSRMCVAEWLRKMQLLVMRGITSTGTLHSDVILKGKLKEAASNAGIRNPFETMAMMLVQRAWLGRSQDVRLARLVGLSTWCTGS